MKFDIDHAILFPWLVLAAWWIVTALQAQRSVRVESSASRLHHLLLTAVSLTLLFRPGARIGPLGWRVVPGSPEAAYIGMALTILGAAFAIWARSALGGNWSAAVTVKENHSLVQRGPYKVVRHPIYSGCLFAMLGTAIVFGEVGCFVAVFLALVAWWLKSRVEEEFMTQQFGDDYRSYQKSVKRLVPFLL
jgi:protein-S-isoprenylcysteine O-methyltransferase Ste14